jgi:hypothetical protein
VLECDAVGEAIGQRRQRNITFAKLVMCGGQLLIGQVIIRVVPQTLGRVVLCLDPVLKLAIAHAPVDVKLRQLWVLDAGLLEVNQRRRVLLLRAYCFSLKAVEPALLFRSALRLFSSVTGIAHALSRIQDLVS